MQHGGRARRWISRGVLGIAALACIATSRPRWFVEAALPVGDAASTPDGGRQALVVTVAASVQPQVECLVPAHGRIGLRPMSDPASPGAAPADPLNARYLCPPGGRLTRIAIDGHGGGNGCERPKPPAGAFVRISKLETVETWTSTSEASFEIEHWRLDPKTGVVAVSIRGPGQIWVEAGVDAASDVAAFGGVNIMGPSRDGTHYDIVLPLVASEIPRGSKLRIRATTYGVCEPGCAPTRPGLVTIEPASQE